MGRFSLNFHEWPNDQAFYLDPNGLTLSAFGRTRRPGQACWPARGMMASTIVPSTPREMLRAPPSWTTLDSMLARPTPGAAASWAGP